MLISVSYNDRYLHSPITIALIFQLVRGLKSSLGEDRASNFSLLIATTEIYNQNYNQQNRIWHNWMDTYNRDSVVRRIFDEENGNFSLEVGNNSNVEHGRVLSLEFSSGKKLFVRFDQGISYWSNWKAMSNSNPISQVIYNFNADEVSQRDRLVSLGSNLLGSGFPTQIFLKIRS